MQHGKIFNKLELQERRLTGLVTSYVETTF